MQIIKASEKEDGFMTYVKDFLCGMSVAYVIFMIAAFVILRYFSLA